MIAIPNMEKPKECGHCDMFIEHNSICHCYLTGSHITFVGEVADDCPLTEIDLIKCKDCKWCEKMEGVLWCNIWHNDTNGLNFCSYAERRE